MIKKILIGIVTAGMILIFQISIIQLVLHQDNY